ncbi:MAG TPA: questin oxidase family protein [Acidimicrobiales bacterium]
MRGTTVTPKSAPARRGPSAGLLDVLDRQVQFDARTRQGLSNHLPMELIALDALGASPARLEEMLGRWAHTMLQPRADPSNFHAFLVDLRLDGIDATVARQMVRLAESPGSEWFHSMIRLAYALEARHVAQIASALADWTAYERVLPGEPPAGGTTPALEVLRRLHGVPLDEPRSHADLGAVTEQEGFAEAIAEAVVDETLSDLALAAAAVHVAQDDIASLHLVTGVQAARALAPLVDDATRARFARRMVQAVAAGYVGAGAPELPTDAELDVIRVRALPPWDVVRAAAVASPDVHVTKLVHSCRIERAATDDPLYDWLAARQVDLLG